MVPAKIVKNTNTVTINEIDVMTSEIFIVRSSVTFEIHLSLVLVSTRIGPDDPENAETVPSQLKNDNTLIQMYFNRHNQIWREGRIGLESECL